MQEEEDPNKKQRITWKDIIEKEEQKIREKQLAESGQQIEVAPITEEEAARLKDVKPDDEDPDAVKQIGTVNPVKDFQKMITDRKVDRVSNALKQMQEVIKTFIRKSLSGDLYDKAFECLETMRRGAISEDEAQTFNRFLHSIKDEFAHGLHSGFFKKMKTNKLSLITKNESEFSSCVTKDEADIFLKITDLDRNKV